MLKYLVILLDDTSVSYCHYTNTRQKSRLISTEHLKAGIRFAMMENLTVQFVYPTHELPAAHRELIHNIDHSDIVPAGYAGKADVKVIDGWTQASALHFERDTAYVLRTTMGDFLQHYALLHDMLSSTDRLNIVFTDVEKAMDADFTRYAAALAELASCLEELYAKGSAVQLNLLTDRLLLEHMNNCNAGCECLTLAPDGQFYVCPAFYLDDAHHAVGNLDKGLDIKNPQLYQLNHAPLCRKCDAYQCKRCIWLNHKTTLEVNTPSHEQCVMAHLERNAARALQKKLHAQGNILLGHEIPEIDYLDPFDVKNEL